MSILFGIVIFALALIVTVICAALGIALIVVLLCWPFWIYNGVTKDADFDDVNTNDDLAKYFGPFQTYWHIGAVIIGLVVTLNVLFFRDGGPKEDFIYGISGGIIQPARLAPITTRNEMVRFKLVGWHPPKHFYVDLQDVETGLVYKQTYVSKHCNGYADLNKLGDEINIQITINKQNDREWTTFNNLNRVFCQ